MALARLTDELSEKLSDIIKSQEDWTGDDGKRIHREYMKIFGEVWSEVVTKFNNPNGSSFSQFTEMSSKEGQHASTGETEETVEETEIRHEGTLIAVTKKRMEYPARLAALLGKTRRLQKNTAEALKVDLPLRAPLEVDDGVSHLDENLVVTAKETLDALSKSSHIIQMHTHRVTHIADAVEIILNNKHHPTEAFLTSTENIM
ncbi:uncharacterized protein [Panulirus ornatus]|uniref:uncharacterized protein n=1 Tax=Panulirus ornatus TaxID=150431 RepID=UPI003A89580E